MQHRNAPLTPNGRRRLVALVEEDGLTFEAAAAAISAGTLGNKAAIAIQGFMGLIERIAADSGSLALHEQVDQVLKGSGLIERQPPSWIAHARKQPVAGLHRLERARTPALPVGRRWV